MDNVYNDGVDDKVKFLFSYNYMNLLIIFGGKECTFKFCLIFRSKFFYLIPINKDVLFVNADVDVSTAQNSTDDLRGIVLICGYCKSTINTSFHDFI